MLFHQSSLSRAEMSRYVLLCQCASCLTFDLSDLSPRLIQIGLRILSSCFPGGLISILSFTSHWRLSTMRMIIKKARWLSKLRSLEPIGETWLVALASHSLGGSLAALSFSRSVCLAPCNPENVFRRLRSPLTHSRMNLRRSIFEAFPLVG